jgi:Na+/melibiose symporter-like transporter
MAVRIVDLIAQRTLDAVDDFVIRIFEGTKKETEMSSRLGKFRPFFVFELFINLNGGFY